MTLCTISRFFRIWCTFFAYPLLVVIFDISGLFNRIVIA